MPKSPAIEDRAHHYENWLRDTLTQFLLPPPAPSTLK
jgi:hypothetical protein